MTPDTPDNKEIVEKQDINDSDDKKSMYAQAFDIYMNDPRNLTFSEVARMVNLKPDVLTRHGQQKGWDQLRINNKSLAKIKQNDNRIKSAIVVDEMIVNTTQKMVEHSTGQYIKLIETISTLPIDPNEVPDDELPRDAQGNIKSRPRRSKLIEDKVTLLNMTIKGFMDMASGAQGLGMVLSTKMTNADEQERNAKNLSTINQMLFKIQINKPEKQEVTVTEVKGKDGE